MGGNRILKIFRRQNPTFYRCSVRNIPHSNLIVFSAKTVKAGGNVLVPCLPTGLLYDLLEHLLSFMEQSNLINIPIYLVSPSAKASLALSQIYSEWYVKWFIL